MPVYSFKWPKKKAAHYGAPRTIQVGRPARGIIEGSFVEPEVTTRCLSCGSWERRCITKTCLIERNLLMVQEAMLDRKGTKVTMPKKTQVQVTKIAVGNNYYCRTCGLLNKYDPCQVCEYEEANEGKSPPIPGPAVENLMAIVNTNIKYATRANHVGL